MKITIDERDIRILMADRCTKNEAISYLKKGSCVNEDIEEVAMVYGVSVEGLRSGKYRGEGLSVLTFEGTEYCIEYVL